jgi:hypothetical protein
MTMHAETEAVKAASIPASPGPIQDDGVAGEAARGSEAGILSIFIIAPTTVGIPSTALPLDLDPYWALQFKRLATQ